MSLIPRTAADATICLQVEYEIRKSAERESQGMLGLAARTRLTKPAFSEWCRQQATAILQSAEDSLAGDVQ